MVTAEPPSAPESRSGDSKSLSLFFTHPHTHTPEALLRRSRSGSATVCCEDGFILTLECAYKILHPPSGASPRYLR